MRRADSRNIILEAARAEFAEQGFAGARVGRVAGRAGLNKQLIYYYFGSKAGLYAAATAREPAPPPAAPSSRGQSSAPAALRSAIASLLASLESRPEVVALLVDRQPSAAASAEAMGWISTATDRVAQAITDGQGMGYFRDDLDPDGVARQVVVLCLGFLTIRQYLPISTAAWARDVGQTLLRAAAW